MVELTQDAVIEWLKLTGGKKLHIGDIQKNMNISPEKYDHLCVILGRLVKAGSVKGYPGRYGYYRCLDGKAPAIEWWNSPKGKFLDIVYPYGYDDDSTFGFDERVVTYEGDVHTLGGLSNEGKTTWALNMLINNMDRYQCRYLTSEHSGHKFHDRITRYTWVDLFDLAGKVKFETIPLDAENYEDQVEPEAINIFDWISLEGDFWLIAKIIKDIKARLTSGMAVVILQKSPHSTDARGGQFVRDFSDFYFTLDKGRLEVIKVKAYRGKNPNGETFGFDIVDMGTKFHNIRSIKKCPVCRGAGFSRGADCESCYGKGWVDK